MCKVLFIFKREAKISRCFHLLIPDGGYVGYSLSSSRPTVRPSPPCCAPGGWPLPSCPARQLPLGSSSWGQGGVGGRGERDSGYLFFQFPPPLWKGRLLSGSPLLSGFGNSSTPGPFKTLLWSSHTLLFPLPCSSCQNLSWYKGLRCLLVLCNFCIF